MFLLFSFDCFSSLGLLKDYGNDPENHIYHNFLPLKWFFVKQLPTLKVTKHLSKHLHFENQLVDLMHEEPQQIYYN